MDAVIYAGIGINILGALFVMFYAIRYWSLFKQNERLSPKMDELKAEWRQKRAIGFGLIIGGSLIALIGCFL